MHRLAIWVALIALLGSTAVVSISGSATASGIAAPWTATTSYPTTTDYQSCVASGGFVYCFGGSNGNGGSTNSVSYASLSVAGIGTWTATTAYPVSTYGLACAAYESDVYCLGGNNGAGNSVYFATLSAGGVGSWASSTSYPLAVYLPSCVVSGSDIFCVGGGVAGGLTAKAYYAPINSSGVGKWKSTKAYPTAIYSESCTAVSSYIYCIGGGNLSSPATETDYSAKLSTGGIGAWKSSLAYVQTVAGASCFALQTSIYCVGGFTSSSSATDLVEYSNVSKGALGPWVANGTYPLSEGTASCVVSDFVVYCVGGNNDEGTNYADAYFASLFLQTPVGLDPITTAFDSHLNEVFVANAGSNNVSVLSAGTGALLATVNVGTDPMALAFDSHTDQVFVSNEGSGNVSVISDATNSIVATVDVGGSPWGIAFDSDTDNLYVAVQSSDLAEINDTTDAVVADPSIGSGCAIGVAFDSVKDEILSANDCTSTVTVLAAKTNKIVATVNVGGGPYPVGVVFDPHANEAFLWTSRGSIVVASGKNYTILGSVPISLPGIVPNLIYAGTTHEIVVTDAPAGIIYAISDAKSPKVTNLTGISAAGGSFDPENSELYLAETGADAAVAIPISAL